MSLLIGWLETALDNLAFASTNNMVVLHQLTAANLALMATVGALTATNKKLVDDLSQAKVTLAATPAKVGMGKSKMTLHPRNYC